MLVPTTRLLIWFALIALPVSVLSVLQASSLAPSLLLIVALLVVAAVDAVRGTRGLEGFAIELPDVIRFSKDRRGQFDVVIRRPPAPAQKLRIGLPLPPSFATEQEDRWILLPGQTERSSVEWSCLPRERGRHPLRCVHLETLSPAGLWAFRQPATVRAELRVYPNLFEDRRHLAGLFLNRGTYGIHAQRMIGKGREFEKLREYVPGDSFEDIHWKATAKRGHPITKVFQIERTQEVYVIIDSSRLSNRPLSGQPENDSNPRMHKPPERTLERYLTAALILGLAAERQSDLFGLATFSDQVDLFLRAKNGQAHYNACRDAIYTLHPSPVTPDFQEVASFLRLRLRRRALLIVLTSLDDPVVAESFLRGLDLLSRQHLVIVNMIQPDDVEPLFTKPNVANIDDLYRRLGGHLQWHKLRELQKIMQRRGVYFHLLPEARLSARIIDQYLDIKRRQLL